MRSVVIEGLVIGLLASVVGLFAGVGLAKLLTALGGDLPEVGLVFSPRTVLVSLALGTGITLLASIMPALRATRVPPIAAVREYGIDEELVNFSGSGCSLGHPIAASGARMITTLIYELQRRGGGIGVAAMCAGGGQGGGVVVEV